MEALLAKGVYINGLSEKEKKFGRNWNGHCLFTGNFTVCVQHIFHIPPAANGHYDLRTSLHGFQRIQGHAVQAAGYAFVPSQHHRRAQPGCGQRAAAARTALFHAV